MHIVMPTSFLPQAAPGEFWVVKPEHADGVKPLDNEKLFLTSTFKDLYSWLGLDFDHCFGDKVEPGTQRLVHGSRGVCKAR